MKHKPNCSINKSCLVYHEDGKCNHPTYGKCDCVFMPNETKKEKCCEKCKGLAKEGCLHFQCDCHTPKKEECKGYSRCPKCNEDFFISHSCKEYSINSSPHIPTGESNQIRVLQSESHGDDIGIIFTKHDDGIYCSIDHIGGEMNFKLDFIEPLLLSKEKQWKDEMAGKIEGMKVIEVIFPHQSPELLRMKNWFNKKIDEILSLLSNNQDTK